MKIGVIGGSGFIGSHIVDKLIDKKHRVTVFDVMKPHRDDVKHIYIDILDPRGVNTVLTGDFDVIYILAAMANVNDAYKNPNECCNVNIQGVANILEAARRNNIKRVIFASTVWIYSHVDSEQVDETTPFRIDKGEHIYTSSKISAELLCQAYKKLYGVDYTILRYGIPYGPRARGGTVLSIFVKRILNNQPIAIFGDGSQYRKFIYVEDLANANVCALKKKAKNQIYNIEGNEKISVKQIAELLEKLMDYVVIEYKDAREGDFSGKDVSTDKIKKELKWKPTIKFEEGVKKYIEWYRESL